jgi:hypothetical protein
MIEQVKLNTSAAEMQTEILKNLTMYPEHTELQFYIENNKKRDECRVSDDFYDMECISGKHILDKDFTLIINELYKCQVDLKTALRSIHLKPVVLDEKMLMSENLSSYPFNSRINRVPVTSSFPYMMSDDLYSWDYHEIHLQKTNICV